MALMGNKELREQFKKSPYIRRFHRISWALPVIIVAISVLLSIHESSWDHFSRAGSLIVVIGIYIAIMDLSGSLYERSRNNYFTMSEFLEIGNIAEFDRAELDHLIAKAKDVEKTNSDNKVFLNHVSRKFRNMEASLVMGGTIIWGYGDLVLALVWDFNA